MSAAAGRRPRASRKAQRFTEPVIREMNRVAAEHGAIDLEQAAVRAAEADINQHAVPWDSPRCPAGCAPGQRLRLRDARERLLRQVRRERLPATRRGRCRRRAAAGARGGPAAGRLGRRHGRLLRLLLAVALGIAPLAAQEPDGAGAAANAEAADRVEQQNGLLRELAEARGRPPQPPRRLAQHFAFSGTTTFHIGDREPLTQKAEIALGGPDRLRYVLSAGGHKNVFLLQDRESAWLRTGTGDFEKYGAREFAVQTWLRWIACRFPWDLGEVLDGLGNDTREFSLDGPLGGCRIELGEDLLPRTLRHAEAVLDLGDWSVQRGGLRMPATWTWNVGGMRQVEHFERIELDVLLFDRAFAPPLQAPRELQWAAEATAGDGNGRPGTDSIAVVRRPVVQLLKGPGDGAWHAAMAGTGAVSAVLWEWLDERGRLVATVAAVAGELPNRLPDEVVAVPQPAGLYLRWLSYAPSVDPAASAASLRDGARQGGLEIGGPVWRLRHPDDGRLHRSELLLPVREP